MICKKADLTVATGCALTNIPLVIISDEKFSSIKNKDKVILDTKSENIISFFSYKIMFVFL